MLFTRGKTKRISEVEIKVNLNHDHIASCFWLESCNLRKTKE